MFSRDAAGNRPGFSWRFGGEPSTITGCRYRGSASDLAVPLIAIFWPLHSGWEFPWPVRVDGKADMFLTQARVQG
jgi:hypothetical protein